ncbi:MAG: iron ABC transporter permease [Chitinophagales bacterium]
MRQKKITILLLLLGIIVAFVFSMMAGTVSIPLRALISYDASDASSVIIWQSRLPAAIMAIVAGSALAVSGLQMQTIFRNPVAGPYVMGISSGAQLGVALFVLTTSHLSVHWISDLSITIAAAGGALVLFSFISFIAARKHAPATILVIGLLITGMCAAVINIIETLLPDGALRNLLFWSFGSLQGITLQQIPMVTSIVMLALVTSMFYAGKMNVLLLGENYAQSSGIEVKQTVFAITTLTCILAGTVTAFCGPIAFIGLAIPHGARILMRTSDHRILLPVTALLGALFCLLCNILTHLSYGGLTIPLNAITSITGAPFIIWLLLKMKGDQL